MEQTFATAVIFKTQLGKSLGSGRFGQVFFGQNPVYRASGSGSVAIKVVRSTTGEVDCKEPYLIRQRQQCCLKVHGVVAIHTS